jgi:hypothetical protein
LLEAHCGDAERRRVGVNPYVLESSGPASSSARMPPSRRCAEFGEHRFRRDAAPRCSRRCAHAGLLRRASPSASTAMLEAFGNPQGSLVFATSNPDRRVIYTIGVSFQHRSWRPRPEADSKR